MREERCENCRLWERIGNTKNGNCLFVEDEESEDYVDPEELESEITQDVESCGAFEPRKINLDNRIDETQIEDDDFVPIKLKDVKKEKDDDVVCPLCGEPYDSVEHGTMCQLYK